MMSKLGIECSLCTKPCSEDEYARHHLAFIFAGINGDPDPICQQFVMRTYRGLDGVADFRFVSGVFVVPGPLFSAEMRGN